jgi:hypothetical protein
MFPADEVTGRAFMPVQGFTVADDTNCTVSGWGTTSVSMNYNVIIIIKILAILLDNT